MNNCIPQISMAVTSVFLSTNLYLPNDAYNYNKHCCVATAFSATIAEFIETHRRGKAMLYKWYKYNMIREGK